MARNRKRAKERRTRRSQHPPGARPGVSTAGVPRPEPSVDPLPLGPIDPLAAPDPLAHGTPDAELADAQLAVGRPATPDESGHAADLAEAADEAEFKGASGNGAVDPDVAELAAHESAVPARRVGPIGRLVNFIQGSWRELQRVQWPDRRQVMQATGVVLGFVIVAGLFLGASDWVSTQLVNFILK